MDAQQAAQIRDLYAAVRRLQAEVSELRAAKSAEAAHPMRSLSEADLRILRQLLPPLLEIFPGLNFTTAEALRDITKYFPHVALQVLPVLEADGRDATRRLGRLFARAERQIINGAQLTRIGEDRSGVVLWKINAGF